MAIILTSSNAAQYRGSEHRGETAAFQDNLPLHSAWLLLLVISSLCCLIFMLASGILLMCRCVAYVDTLVIGSAILAARFEQPKVASVGARRGEVMRMHCEAVVHAARLTCKGKAAMCRSAAVGSEFVIFHSPCCQKEGAQCTFACAHGAPRISLALVSWPSRH